MRGRVAPLLLVAELALTACAGPSDAEAGAGLPVLSAADAARVLDSAQAGFAEHSGALSVGAEGCFRWASDDALDGAWIVWPDTYRQDADVVFGPDGARIADGDPLRFPTALVAVRDLPGGAEPDSYFGSFGAFCAAEGVVVLGAPDH